MLGNSSPSNDPLVPSNPFFTNSSIPMDISCLFHEPGSIIYLTFNITFILLHLPLCIFILHHGLQQWRQNRSASSASHSDIFTYHLVAMEVVCAFGCVLTCCGVYRYQPIIIMAGLALISFTWYGETFFHILTCVERYLAVVHPITYLSLRNQRGIRIRNISISCVWLLSFGGMSFLKVEDLLMIVAVCLSLSSLLIISFCSLSVLRVLIRPGPGEQGRGRERVDQSKLRAFYTIVTILGALLLRFVGDLILAVMYVFREGDNCLIMACEAWFTLPSSLVLPLLFLHRRGQLVCCQKNNQ